MDVDPDTKNPDIEGLVSIPKTWLHHCQECGAFFKTDWDSGWVWIARQTPKESLVQLERISNPSDAIRTLEWALRRDLPMMLEAFQAELNDPDEVVRTFAKRVLGA